MSSLDVGYAIAPLNKKPPYNAPLNISLFILYQYKIVMNKLVEPKSYKILVIARSGYGKTHIAI